MRDEQHTDPEGSADCRAGGSGEQDQAEHIVQAAETRAESRTSPNEPGADYRTCSVPHGEGHRGAKRNRGKQVDQECAGHDGGPDAISDEQHSRESNSSRRPNGRHIPTCEWDGETHSSGGEVCDEHDPQLKRVLPGDG
jgi:hypothetical protein